jgi:ferredoxin
VRVTVDLAKCRGYTACAALCPDVYQLDEDGFAYVDDEVVPPEFEETVEAGADACPERAITVTEA